MNPTQIVILAIIQGLAELLPVSSSAHVIAAAKLMRLDPSAPQFTMLLVMLHTGTMFAVIVYFWQAWKRTFFSSQEQFGDFAKKIIVATVVTVIVAFGLKWVIEHYLKHRQPGIVKAEIEDLFKHLDLLAGALAAVGLLILYSGLRSRRQRGRDEITAGDSLSIGAIQGLCLPFRGFSRSGATISLGLLNGVARRRLEEYSFALAVVLTPGVIFWEARRLLHFHSEQTATPPAGIHLFLPSLIGMTCSFLAGLVALKLLSRLLERGEWWIFGIYCLAASAALYWMHRAGF